MNSRGLLAALLAVALLLLGLLVWMDAEEPTLPEPVAPSERSTERLAGLGATPKQEPRIETATRSVEASPTAEERALRTPEEPVLPVKPPRPMVLGRVTLTDGTLAAGMELVAVFPETEHSGRVLLMGRRSPEHLYSQTWTNKQGEFKFEFERGQQPDVFRIEQVNRLELGQNGATYEFDPEGFIEHTVPGGRLTVEVLGPEGLRANDQRLGNQHVRIEAVFTTRDAEGREQSQVRQSYTNSEALFRFYYNEPARVSVSAVRPYDGAFGELNDLVLDPTEPNRRHVLSLVPLSETGSLKLIVIDDDGLPVLDFGVSLRASDGSFGPRYVYSEELGPEGIFSGLPLGPLDIQFMERYRSPPSLYAENGVPIRKAMISRDDIDEVQVRVSIQTRLLFDLRRDRPARTDFDERAELGVRYRYADEPDAEWASTSFLHRYLENSGVRLGGMSEAGLYCTDVVREGQLDLELFDVLTDEVVWTGSTKIRNGTLTPVLVEL